MAKLSDFHRADLAALLGHMSFATSGLSSTATAVTYATTATAGYTIDGVFKSRTAVAAQSLITNSNEAYTAAQMTVPISTTAYFSVGVNAAGGLKNTAGLTPQPNGALTWSGKVPTLPTGLAPLGYIKIVTGSSQFVPGTTNLDATTGGMAITFVPCSLLPLAESP